LVDVVFCYIKTKNDISINLVTQVLFWYISKFDLNNI